MPDAPRVRVAALITYGESVVLVRHRAGDRTYHLLPGGGVDYRETLEDALRREVREETGLEVAIGHPVFLNDTIDPAGRRHLVNITFAATVTGGAITNAPVDNRVEAVDLIDPGQLSAVDLRPPLAPFILQALEEGLSESKTRYLGPLFTPEPR